jgi:hypothetical protein
MSHFLLSIRRIVLPLAALVLIDATTSAAQTKPGIAFKIRTQLRNNRVPERSRPDSVRIKRQAAEAAARAAADVDVGGDAPPTSGRGGPGGGGNTGANNVLQMNGSFIKGMGRMDVQGVIGSPELTATQSALFTDTSSTVIDDVEKQYWARVFDIGSILAFTSAVDNPQASVGMLKVSWDSLPGETIEGRPAKHYQLKMKYGLAQRGREDSLKLLAVTDVVSDYWVVDLPVNFENRFAGIGRPRRQVPDSLRGEWEKMLGLYALLGKGTIVKFQATGIIGENGPSATQYTRTMEMTGIKTADIDEATLKVPADYTRRATGRGGRGGAP